MTQASTDQSPDRIYLDNAATSWPKPPSVLQAITDFYNQNGSAAGRGDATSQFSSDLIVERCRTKLREFVGGRSDDQIVFAFNGTDAINIGLFGFLNRGDHVVTTSIEHNSVMRPLEMLRKDLGVEFTVVPCRDDGTVSPDEIKQEITSDTKLVIVSHASNVTGVIQNVRAIGDVCRECDASLMLDAAQTAGQLSIDVASIGCDMLAAPGHKGLMGPLGTGFLYISQTIADQMKPWRTGGTGTQSELSSQPMDYPNRLEAGNLNLGGIAGLLAGLEFINSVGVDAVRKHEQKLIELAIERLSDARIQLYCPDNSNRVGVLSMNIADIDSREIATILDASFGIQTRAGFHCSPTMHRFLNTFQQGGTVRISPGWYSTEQELARCCDAVLEIAAM